ncbi:hypothetical protein HOLleu_08230 [Holothuria leucospilota]|uniref:Ig-like domain-containing protein n=1 Tax=Holothuria leucospilota TaxID=206669 RepID=A0A9Q1CIV0_HOLLE|nr:hypothetical protein HOLleu_08230 [Holothuria leucospilota]
MLYFVTVTVFLFSFLNHGETNSLTTRLTISSSTAHIRVGSSVTLSCNIFDLEDDFFNQQNGAVVFFRFENNNVRTQLSYYNPGNFSTTHPRYQVSGIQRSDRYVVNLEITEVVELDASEYQCVLHIAGKFKKGSQHIWLEMIHTAPIEYPKCVAYVQNDMLHLSCESTDSSPRPDLVWFHNGVEVSRRIDLRYSLTLNDLIMNLTDIDGTYECRFYYIGEGINDERSCRIEKPNIMFVSPTNAEFINGSHAEMTVLARANPPMTTAVNCEWDHSSSNDFSVQNDANDLTIISIRNIDLTMNGSEITCCGRNFLGQNCRSISLNVKEAGALPCFVPASNASSGQGGLLIRGVLVCCIFFCYIWYNFDKM